MIQTSYLHTAAVLGYLLMMHVDVTQSLGYFPSKSAASSQLRMVKKPVALLRPFARPVIALQASSDGDKIENNIPSTPENDLPSLPEVTVDSRRRMSWPFHMFYAPPLLDGSLACDAGFDPLGIVKSKEQLFELREAEIKHARIAMLAALGWPVSELCHYTLAKLFGVDNLLSEGVKAPSVLNGGLDNQYVLLGLGFFFAVGAVLEFEYMKRKKEVPASLANFYNMWQEDGWDVPGNYDFDPLNLRDSICGVNDERKILVQSLEMINGRVAMLATVGFAIQEAYTGLPVIEETPSFFYPFFFD